MQDAYHRCTVPQRGWWAGQDWRRKKDQTGPWFVWPGTWEIISSKNISKAPSEKSLPENSSLGRSDVCYFSSFIFATKGGKWVCSLHLGFLAFPVTLTHVTPAISLALWPRWVDNSTRCVLGPLALRLRSALGVEWRRAALGCKLLTVSHTRFPVVPTQGTYNLFVLCDVISRGKIIPFYWINLLEHLCKDVLCTVGVRFSPDSELSASPFECVCQVFMFSVPRALWLSPRI